MQIFVLKIGTPIQYGLWTLIYGYFLCFQEIQKVFYKKKRTEIKSSAGDPVTETDKLIEKIFVTTIKETYPNHR